MWEKMYGEEGGCGKTWIWKIIEIGDRDVNLIWSRLQRDVGEFRVTRDGFRVTPEIFGKNK